MPNNIKEKHHYITRYYLEGFSDKDSRVWTYKKSDPSNPFPNKATDTAVINKLYHLVDNGNINEVEDYFSDEIEDPASNAFKKLLEMKFPDTNNREKLSLFFGMLMARTPSYIKHINEQQKRQLQVIATTSALDKENFSSTYKNLHPELDDDEIESDRLLILNGEFSFELKRDVLLKIMLKFGSTFAPFIEKMKWSLIKTNDEYPFITSDNFMHVYHPTIRSGFHKIGLGTPNVYVHIPISSNLSLMLINSNDIKDDLIYDCDNPPLDSKGEKINLKELVKSLNKRIFCACDQYVFSNSNSSKLIQCFSNLLKQACLIENIGNKENNYDEN